MKISQEVRKAADEVVSAPASGLAEALNRFIGRFVGWPLKVAPGFARDHDGNRTGAFASVVYAESRESPKMSHEGFHADSVAAVVDAYEELDRPKLRAAYGNVAKAKSLKKSPAPDLKGVPITTVTLGIIFSLRSAVPLEVLAEELEHLNAQSPDREWPDMIIVASTGTIQYAAQFPGEGLSGDFLPPGEGATKKYTPPTYVVMTIRPTGDYTLNKMLAFLVAHLAIFSPGAKLPAWAEIIEGVPKNAVTLSGYQYDQSGELKPVPRHLYNDRYLGPLPVRVEDQQGSLLSTLQFVPWQDGGVIILKGNLPLEGVLVFLGSEVLKRGGVVKTPDAEISYALPIDEADFRRMLARFQSQSNIVVRPDQTNWVVKKVADEGSQSPFMARLLMGLLRLRDAVFTDEASRKNFDKSFELATSSLLTARSTAKVIAEMWSTHVRKVEAGDIVRVRGRTIQVDESIDNGLRQQVESFLNTATRVLKQGMQAVTSDLQVNIGFLFQKPAGFDAGIAILEKTDPDLAEYLRKTRDWSERLLGRRNAVEHEGWILPPVTYVQKNGRVNAIEPSIAGQPVSEFVAIILDRLACFVEELTAHCLQRQLPTGITITELPLADRDKEMPERFRVTLANGGMPAWRIVFHQSSFENS
jgi:hypothetical protein